MGGTMMVRRLGVILATVLLCGCVPVVAGCGSIDGASTIIASIATDTTVATETATTDTALTSPGESSQFFPVLVDGKWGYIDSKGTIKIEPQFDWATGFSEGLAMVGVGFTPDGPEKWGYIDTSGAIVIEPQFTQATDLSEGLAVVTVLQGGVNKRGFVDKNGAIVVPLEHAYAYAFSEGLGRVCGADQSSYYFVDKTGATVLGPYDLADDFSEGLAWVERGAKRGFIDKNGDWVAGPAKSGRASDFDYVQGFSEGLSAAQTLATPPVFGYVDKTGAWVIEPRFGYAESFSEGLAVVGVGIHEFDKLGPYGYVDTSGSVFIAAQFDGARAFSEGLAGVYVAGKCGFIDKTGAMVIPAQYVYAGDFSGGLAEVRVTGSESGPSYIDKTGKIVWQGQ
jgi:hypothetical protein